MLNLFNRNRYRYDKSKPELKNLCDELAFYCGDIVWRCDDRFNAVYAEFTCDDQQHILPILERYFTDYWDFSTINRAPYNVQELSQKLDGVHPGQLLIHSDACREDFIYCAWWPWTNKKQLTIRFGYHVNDDGADANKALTTEVKELMQCFGVRKS